MSDHSSIHDILASIADSNDYDTKFLIAASLNLYLESRRRKHGQVLFGVEDIDPIFSIVSTVLRTHALPKPSEVRSRELTEEEGEKLLKAIQEDGERRA